MRPEDDDEAASTSSASEVEDESDDASEPDRIDHTVKKSHTEDHIIHPTSFDAYFEQNAARAQTSTNVFSALVPPLSQEEYLAGIASVAPHKLIKSELDTSEGRNDAFRQMMVQLAAGFNILGYGYGSKRRLLNAFAREYCAKAGHVVVANAFQPHFSLKEMLIQIERIPGITSLDLASSTVEGFTNRIYEFFTSSKRDLYLIIHNIDSPSLRSQRTRSCLSLLALHPRIHLVASIDHLNAPLLWSLVETSARKELAPSNGDPPRGFSWLWHDLTTLEPYDLELAHADRSSIQGARAGGKGKDANPAQRAAAVSETAALHILASVTQKAKKLFALMANKQLEAVGEGGETADLEQAAITYDSLYNLARSEFIATSDTALRALLGEFRDHNLVLASQGTTVGESLWIPLRKNRLETVLKAIDTI